MLLSIPRPLLHPNSHDLHRSPTQHPRELPPRFVLLHINFLSTHPTPQSGTPHSSASGSSALQSPMPSLSASSRSPLSSTGHTRTAYPLIMQMFTNLGVLAKLGLAGIGKIFIVLILHVLMVL
ncbi:hypothetical protein H2248_011676 [Termitomyces sp. 'cryptogamus']|nr:hypothetical protein H2248_011676 [Termitomyces sp. 'cryptogamus']